MQFTPTETFFCAETQSEYVKGLSYTVRSLTEYADRGLNEKTLAQIKARCDALAVLVPQWLQDGKIVAGSNDSLVRGG